MQDPAPRQCRCGAVLDVASWWTTVVVADGRDPLYGLPFYLLTPCAGHVLWAANLDHIAYLEQFLGAPNRPNDRQLGHRLPGWMLEKRNRRDVLHGLGVLRARAARLVR
ncbi:MAG TPA: hypothetical protein VGC57_11785 [Cellulomonas sp.]